MGLEHFLLLEAISAFWTPTKINYVSMKLPEIRVTWITAVVRLFFPASPAASEGDWRLPSAFSEQSNGCRG